MATEDVDEKQASWWAEHVRPEILLDNHDRSYVRTVNDHQFAGTKVYKCKTSGFQTVKSEHNRGNLKSQSLVTLRFLDDRASSFSTSPRTMAVRLPKTLN
ncbi:hypothetical protein L2E82_06155 [Cichorium intybus]|uniref:Uncharacterized protein n=1 Tax=Cichorium intybus TaxID=13427 RepID=A0ACB9HAH0_CICIN|nr:hypothetical protein L2E82_06155 [Cichorium intybus]